MPIDILMPGVGADATHAGIARWTRNVGEAVRKDEVLVEIETDKAIVEVTAPDDGVLARIDARDGAERVPVGAVIGLLALAGEEAASVDAAVVPLHAQAAAPSSSSSSEASAVTAIAPAVEEARVAATAGARGRVAASPLARRIARGLNVDLASVRGSGPRGRVLRMDVERAAGAPAAPVLAAAAATSAASAASDGGDERIPHTGMRRAIAQRLTASKQAIPHFYLSIDADVDALLALRAELAKQAGFKPSLNDFCVKAAAAALVAVPAVNARWTDEAVVRRRSVDVSVAVASHVIGQ